MTLSANITISIDIIIFGVIIHFVINVLGNKVIVILVSNNLTLKISHNDIL